MARYAASRILQAIPTMIIVSMLVFGLIRMAPGDPATMQMGTEASNPDNFAKLEALREQMGLTKPIPVQYLRWIEDLAGGDFGDSLRNKRSTVDLFMQKLPATLELLLGSMLFALFLALPLGILSAVKRGTTLDRAALGFVSAGLAIPGFWLGLTLILIFSVRLQWLPASGYVPFREDPVENIRRLILPSITLGTYLAASLMRFLRSDMIQVLGADYIRTARAKGLREKSVIMRHAMKNALIPVLTVAGLEVGALLGGAVIIEQVFGWSGVGWLTVQAIFDRDYPLVQTCVLFVTVGLILVNLVTDLAYGLLNPRMRVSSAMEQQMVTAERSLDGRKRTLSSRIFGGRADPVMILSALVLLLFLAWAIFPGLFATHPPNKIGPELLKPPSRTWLFGTDEFGRDIYSRVVYGARIEFVISSLGVLIAMAIGIPAGLVAGYRGGWIDSVLMRMQDALLAFPSILFAILIVAARGASQQSIIITVGIIFIPRFARLVRASVLSLKEEEFVTASRAIGASSSRLLWRHILPNALPAILVQVTLTMAVAVLVEAGLSYLGLGVQPPTATWGTMLKNAQSYPSQAPWFVLAPGICLFLLVLTLNTFGDGLGERLDPRIRRL